MQAHVDLSVATIRALAKGNPENLPRFMVHDDSVWPWGVVQMDSLKRIHLRRTDFLSVVAPQIPVRAGVWHRVDLQEFIVDLAAHNLDGDGTGAASTLAEVREIATDPDRCPECRSPIWRGRYGVQCSACAWGHSTGLNLAIPLEDGETVAGRFRQINPS